MSAPYLEVLHALATDHEFGSLTVPQLWIVGTIATDGPKSMSELGEALGWKAPNVTKHATKLTERGLLKRTHTPGDLLRVYLAATRKGMALAIRVRETVEMAQHKEVAA